MASILWQGDASAVKQTETLTVGGSPHASQTFKTTMTGEDGSTVTITTTGGSTATSTVASTIKGELAASTNSLFQAVTWTVAGAVITGTANTAGRPFYVAAATTGSSGTYADAVATSSVGPNDFNVAANWYVTSTAASQVPTTGDSVLFFDGSVDVLYGLNQSAKTFTLVATGSEYKGRIGGYVASGNPNSGYYLKCSATKVRHASGGQETWIQGTLTDVYVIGGNGSRDYLHLGGTVGDIYCTQPTINGKVTVADSGTIGRIRVADAPGCILDTGIGAGTITATRINSGQVTIGRQCNEVNLAGGVLYRAATSLAYTSTLNQYGGTFYNQSHAAIGNYVMDGGQAEFGQNKRPGTSVTVFIQHGGTLKLTGGGSAVDFAAKVVQHGGRIITDSGFTVNVNA